MNETNSALWLGYICRNLDLSMILGAKQVPLWEKTPTCDLELVCI